jgi:hypothetical protein
VLRPCAAQFHCRAFWEIVDGRKSGNSQSSTVYILRLKQNLLAEETAMNKKDEINKKSIIVGITSVAIIAIAIIAVISIFTIKSHAQVKENDKVALSVFKKAAVKLQKDDYKATRYTDKQGYAPGVVKAEKEKLAKVDFKKAEQKALKYHCEDKPAVAVAKAKDWPRVDSLRSFKTPEKLALHKVLYKEKEVA